MSLKDKLEIGLKPDAPYRPDNLPEHEQGDPACVEGANPGDDPATEAARQACDDGATRGAVRRPSARRPTRAPVRRGE
jgi:hypothetical protein